MNEHESEQKQMENVGIVRYKYKRKLVIFIFLYFLTMIAEQIIILVLFFKMVTNYQIMYHKDNDNNIWDYNNKYAYVTKYDGASDDSGGYFYSFETSNGIQRDESAELVNPGSDNEILAVRGSYSYMGPDGNSYMVEYTADENGFQPAGEHIPQSAGVRRLGVPSAALASLAGGGLG